MRTLLCIILVLMVSTGCVGTPPPQHVVTEQPQSVSTAVVETQQVEIVVTPTHIPTQEPTQTTVPVDPYIFKTEKGDLDISTGQLHVLFNKGLLAEKELSASIISPKNLGGFPNTSEGLRVGTGVGVIRPENYGNLLLNLHSAYLIGDVKRPLEAEFLRFALERWGKEDTSYVEKNLNKIVGSTGVLQINDSALSVEILGGIRLNNEDAKELQAHPEEVLDIVTKSNKDGYLAIGDVSIFEKIKNGGHEILISFCGWGPNQETTYYRYVLLMNVTESTDTPDNIN